MISNSRIANGRRPGALDLTEATSPPPIGLTDIEHAVLRHIRLHPGKSRTEIAADLALSKSMLSKAVAKFDEAGLVVEERATLEGGERGQPPIRLSLNDNAFHSIGVYINRQHCAVVRTDLGGKVHQALLSELHDEGPAIIDGVLENVAALVDHSPAPILGIGHALSAIVASDGGLFEITPTQVKLPLPEIASALTARFGLPVYWENAAYCVAAFEAHRPEQNRRCVFHLTMDFGIGGGLVMNGTVFRGAYNQASNIGALIPETGPRPSIIDLARHLDRSTAQLTEAYLSKLFADGDPRLLGWIDARGPLLSVPLAATVQLVNPDVITVGGFFPREVLEALCAKVDFDVLDTPGRRPLTKPVLTVTDLLGPSGFAEAAALLPVSARLLGQQAVLAGQGASKTFS